MIADYSFVGQVTDTSLLSIGVVEMLKGCNRAHCKSLMVEFVTRES